MKAGERNENRNFPPRKHLALNPMVFAPTTAGIKRRPMLNNYIVHIVIYETKIASKNT